MNEESTSLEDNNSQEGLEKLVGKITTYITKVQLNMTDIFYGAYLLQEDKNANSIKKALDRGLLNLLEELTRIDFCNIFSYFLNSKLGKSFNPSDPPPDVTDSAIKKAKYYVQIEAYKMQARIDKFYGEYGTDLGSDARKGLQELFGVLGASMASLVSGRLGLNDPVLRKEFPEVDLISNFLRDKLTEVSSIASNELQQFVPAERIQAIFSTVDKIRSYCVAIQALNNPAQVIAGFAPAGLQKQIEELNKIVKYDKVIPLIYNILKTCNNINNVCRSILGYVSRGRLIVRVCILLIKAFNAIMAFFVALPTFPVPAGAGVAFSNTFQNQLKERGEKKLLKVLKQVSNALDEIYNLVSSVVAIITQIMQYLQIIVLNLQSCKGNDDVINEINQTIANLEDTRRSLQQFLDDVNKNKSEAENTYGEYTIEIVQEQVVDEGISLRRRYGIARGSNGVIAVQSTPTFASLDLIIINEVKLLLEAAGLVKPSAALSTEDSLLVDYASKYLEDNDLNSSITITQDGIGTDSTGLQGFMNNLPGGKALRNRIRKQLLANSAKLGSDLKGTDPNGKYSKSITPGG